MRLTSVTSRNTYQIVALCRFCGSQDAARERMRLRAEIAADKEARKVCPCLSTSSARALSVDVHVSVTA
jgi:hypothetical protein